MAKQTSTASTRRPVSRTGARRPGSGRGKGPAGTELLWGFPLQKQNLIGIGLGLLLIVIGYLCMSTGMVADADVATNEGTWNSPMAVTIAPILLVLGYCVVIPLSIIYRPKGNSPEVTVTNRTAAE